MCFGNEMYRWNLVSRVNVESDLTNSDEWLVYINRNLLRGTSGTLYEFNEGLSPMVYEGLIIYAHWGHNTTPFEVVGIEVLDL